jgi:DNA-binding response OmpR family regulator
VTGRVLVIDKDIEPAAVLQSALIQEGFETDHSRPGIRALRKALIDQPDVVILGIDNDEHDWQFCSQLLAFVDRPVLLLVEPRRELACVRGLEEGADDCLVKPIRAVEVIAHVRALLRRRERHTSRSRDGFFVDEDLVVDLARGEVRRHDEPVLLTAMEFRILEIFTRHVNEVMSHERLAVQIWGSHSPEGSAALKQYVYQLRQKLEPDPGQPQRIVTRRGRGYIFRSLAD